MTTDTSDDFFNMAVASQLFPRAQLHLADPHPILQASAEWCAEEQARRGRQGHYEWNRRFRELLEAFGEKSGNFSVNQENRWGPETLGVVVTSVEARGDRWTFAEIAAESWPRQTNDSPAALWADAFRSWAHSSGHWQVASTRHRIAGAAMRLGKNGIWYTAVVVGD